MVGVVLAAGSGSRFIEEYGAELCKALVKVGGRPIIEYSLENLFRMKVERIYIVVGKYADDIKGTVGKEYRSIPVIYVSQESPVGLINALSKTLFYFDDNMTVQLGDEIFLGADIPGLCREIESGRYDFHCCITREEDEENIKKNYSVELDGEFRLLRCTEKPKTVPNLYKGTGFCVFSRACVRFLRERYNQTTNFPFDLCDYMNALIAAGKIGKCFLLSGREINVNTVSDFNYAKSVALPREDGGDRP
ncbi:MAG: NTP transferase domain-containing protein [Clostridia bacterium]|nr:NTP transferase domain-containing protein [Clostridia bacterium]MBR5428699.1 NTP transferase domain-containing protein [Clostridia bacterium]